MNQFFHHNWWELLPHRKQASAQRAPTLPRLALPALICSVCMAQSAAPQAGRIYRETHERQIVGEFLDLLAISNLASDTTNIRRNAQAISELFKKRGVRTKLLAVADAPPVVYGEIV